MISILGWMAGWPAECFPSGKDCWKTRLLEKSLIAMMKGELVVFSCFQGKQNEFSTSSVIKFVRWAQFQPWNVHWKASSITSLHCLRDQDLMNTSPRALASAHVLCRRVKWQGLSQKHVHGIPTKFSALTLSLLFSLQIPGSFFPSSMKVQRNGNLTTFSLLEGIMRVSGDNGHSWIWYSPLQWQNQTLCLNNTMMLWGWHLYLRAMIKFV